MNTKFTKIITFISCLFLCSCASTTIYSSKTGKPLLKTQGDGVFNYKSKEISFIATINHSTPTKVGLKGIAKIITAGGTSYNAISAGTVSILETVSDMATNK